MLATSPQHLQDVLHHLHLWLEHGARAHCMVTTPTREEFHRQPLPPHLRTSVKMRTGPRVAVRSARDGRVHRQAVARWPQDGLVESSLPTLMCVVSGAADLHFADYVVHCQTGDILYRPPGLASIGGALPHFEGEHKGRSCDLLWIFPGRLNGQGLESYICHSREYTHRHSSHLWFKSYFLSTLFQELVEEIERNDNRESIERLLGILIFSLHRHVQRGDALIPPFSTKAEKDAGLPHEPVQLAQSYIDLHLDRHLTTELVARQVGLSASVFKRKFKQTTGHTFNQYLTHARLKKAAELLDGSEMFVSEVSNMIGLTECQFRRLARQHWGCTPREFRHRESDPI